LEREERCLQAILAASKMLNPERDTIALVGVVDTSRFDSRLLPFDSAEEPFYFDEERTLFLDREKAEKWELMRRNSAFLAEKGFQKVTEMVVPGNPKQEIVEIAAKNQIDVIFVGARGLGRIEKFFLGSVSEYVASHALCSVMVCR